MAEGSVQAGVIFQGGVRYQAVLFRLLCLLLIGTLLALPGARATAAEAAWQPLGALGPFGVSALAVAPGWPVQKTIVANRGTELILSVDGGGHWQRHGAPPTGHLNDLTFAASDALLAITDEGVWRSSDLGLTWTSSLVASHATPYVAGGASFVLDDQGNLWRSQDAGQSWQALQPAEGQFVQSLRISPGFATDHTLVAAVAGGRRFTPGVLLTDFPLADADSSSGVMVSTDGGDSWVQRADGLAVDDASYHAVQDVVISPTFGSDNTLFAVAWGDPQPSLQYGQAVTAFNRALFRSTDRGMSWQALGAEGPFNFPTRAELVLSPNFATDGVALWAKNFSSGTPASGSCTISRTTDSGETWTQVLATTAQYSGCESIELLAVNGHVIAHAQVSTPINQQWSEDAGETWTAFPLSPFPLVFASAPGTIFVGFKPFSGSGGLFALGSDLTPSSASLDCASPLAGGFARVMTEHPEVRNLLGCPIEAEHNVQIRAWADKIGPGSLVLSPDDGASEPVVLFPTPFSYTGSYRAAEVTVNPKDPPDAVVAGAVQHFEGGGSFIFTRGLNDGSNTIYAVSGNGIWADFADPPE